MIGYKSYRRLNLWKNYDSISKYKIKPQDINCKKKGKVCYENLY